MAARSSWAHEVLVAAARREIPSGLVAGRSPLLWRRLVDAGNGHGVSGWVARELRGRTEVPSEFQVELQGAAVRIAGNHRRRVEDARHTLGALRGAGVDALVLKGPELVERYYRDETLRPYGDVDLLVRRRSLRDAVQALRDAGFGLVDQNWPLMSRDLRGELHFIRPEGGLAEVHWDIVDSGRVRKTFSVDTEELLDVAVGGEVAGTPTMLLPPAEEVAYLCLHATLHSCRKLRWLLDISVVANEGEVDWDQTARRLQRWRFGEGGYLVLALTHRWTGARIPLADLRSLRPGPLVRGLYSTLVNRWDLGRRPSMLTELFMATGRDRLWTRVALALRLVAPAPGHGHDRRGRPRMEGLRRLTVDTAERVRRKLTGAPDPLTAYEAAGDPHTGLANYLDAVESALPSRG